MLSGSALCPITIDRMPNGTTAANSHGHGAMARIAPPTVGANAAALAAMTVFRLRPRPRRSEEHTSELQSLMRLSYAVFRLNKNNAQRQSRHWTRNNTKND